MSSPHSSRCPRVVGLLLSGFVLAILCAPTALAQDATDFVGLDAGQRVYDETDSSLTAAEITDLAVRLDDLRSTGADTVVYVRDLDASPEQTLEQVEELQQAWVAETGAEQDTAVAILVNRNPDDLEDARAGIFVGRVYNDGNVPEDEQREIIEDALIPPLRDGDVHASLAAGLDRLESSIRNGPPTNAFERWSADAASSWLGGTAIGLAAAGLLTTLTLFGRRETTDGIPPVPTTRRPGKLPPAVVGALVAGGPQASLVPAILLDLAGRRALVIEMEREGGTLRQPEVRVRLLDRQLLRGGIEAAVWDRLAELAEDGIVGSGGLKKLAHGTGPALEATRAQLRSEGWLAQERPRPRVGLAAIAAAGVVLAVLGAVVAANGDGDLLVWTGVGLLGLLSLTAMVLWSLYSPLTAAGQTAAAPWVAYRDGLRQSAKDQDAELDLDTALPDIVALNLGATMGKRLKAADAAGQPIRAFAGSGGARGATFPWWVAFSSSTTAASSSGTTSGSGAGGGGGAAGST